MIEKQQRGRQRQQCMKDRADRMKFWGIGQQGGGNQEKQAIVCLAGTIQRELRVKKSAAEQTPEKKLTAPVQQDADAGKIGGKQVASACEQEGGKGEKNERKYPSNHRDSVGKWGGDYTGKKRKSSQVGTFRKESAVR